LAPGLNHFGQPFVYIFPHHSSHACSLVRSHPPSFEQFLRQHLCPCQKTGITHLCHSFCKPRKGQGGKLHPLLVQLFFLQFFSLSPFPSFRGCAQLGGAKQKRPDVIFNRPQHARGLHQAWLCKIMGFSPIRQTLFSVLVLRRQSDGVL
jgi:hypothetical protein